MRFRSRPLTGWYEEFAVLSCQPVSFYDQRSALSGAAASPVSGSPSRLGGMEQLGISAIHPTAPEFLSAAALYKAPIDVEAAVTRLGDLWNEKIEPTWSTVEPDPNNPAAPSGDILHFAIEGIQVMLSPINHGLVIEEGQLPLHRFHVAATFYAPEAGAMEGKIAGEGAGVGDNLKEVKKRHRMLSAHVVYTEVMDALMREPAALGVYRYEMGVMQPPAMITELSEMLTKGQAPMPLWINIRLHQPALTRARTLGLGNFGHLDLEVIDSKRSGEDVYNFLANVANYIVTSDTYLLPGQTLGYTKDESLDITQEVSDSDGATVIRIGF